MINFYRCYKANGKEMYPRSYLMLSEMRDFSPKCYADVRIRTKLFEPRERLAAALICISDLFICRSPEEHIGEIGNKLR